jgi:hypothetical protein
VPIIPSTHITSAPSSISMKPLETDIVTMI